MSLVVFLFAQAQDGSAEVVCTGNVTLPPPDPASSQDRSKGWIHLIEPKEAAAFPPRKPGIEEMLHPANSDPATETRNPVCTHFTQPLEMEPQFPTQSRKYGEGYWLAIGTKETTGQNKSSVHSPKQLEYEATLVTNFKSQVSGKLSQNRLSYG